MDTTQFILELVKIGMFGAIVSLVYLSWQRPKATPTYHLDKFCDKYDIDCHK